MAYRVEVSVVDENTDEEFLYMTFAGKCIEDISGLLLRNLGVATPTMGRVSLGSAIKPSASEPPAVPLDEFKGKKK